MIRSDSQWPETILASVGGAILHLILRPPNGDGAPTLASADGVPLDAWRVELLRWPAEAEPALRAGGYLLDRDPGPTELWCNCAD
jgi:hypothetical protein